MKTPPDTTVQKTGIPTGLECSCLNLIDGFSATASILVERAEAAPPEESRDLLGEAYELMGPIDAMIDGQTPDRDGLDAWSGFKRKGGRRYPPSPGAGGVKKGQPVQHFGDHYRIGRETTQQVRISSVESERRSR